MFKYVAMVAGILIMCVSEDASLTHFILQAGLGLVIFIGGAYAAINEEASR